MRKILELFAEENGQLSNMRLNVTLVIATACFLCVYVTVKGNQVDLGLIGLLLTTGFGAKYLQKGKE